MIMHGVNLKTWNGLPEDVQTFLTSEIATWENEVWNAADAETQAGIACNTGGECIKGNPAISNLFRSLMLIAPNCVKLWKQ